MESHSPGGLFMLHVLAKPLRPSNKAISTKALINFLLTTVVLSSTVSIGYSCGPCAADPAPATQQAKPPSPSPSAYSRREEGSTVTRRSDGSVSVEDDWAPFSSDGSLATPSSPNSYVPPAVPAPATTRASSGARTAPAPASSRNYSDYVPVTTHTSGGMKTYTTGWSYVGDEGGGSSGVGYIGSGSRSTRRAAGRPAANRAKSQVRNGGQRAVRHHSGGYRPMTVRRHADGTVETSEEW